MPPTLSLSPGCPCRAHQQPGEDNNHTYHHHYTYCSYQQSGEDHQEFIVIRKSTNHNLEKIVVYAIHSKSLMKIISMYELKSQYKSWPYL